LRRTPRLLSRCRTTAWSQPEVASDRLHHHGSAPDLGHAHSREHAIQISAGTNSRDFVNGDKGKTAQKARCPIYDQFYECQWYADRRKCHV